MRGRTSENDINRLLPTETIGHLLGYTHAGIRCIEKRALEKMREKLIQNGIVVEQNGTSSAPNQILDQDFVLKKKPPL